jgi:sortase (surface protein transpeptidase)
MWLSPALSPMLPPTLSSTWSIAYSQNSYAIYLQALYLRALYLQVLQRSHSGLPHYRPLASAVLLGLSFLSGVSVGFTIGLAEVAVGTTNREKPAVSAQIASAPNVTSPSSSLGSSLLEVFLADDDESRVVQQTAERVTQQAQQTVDIAVASKAGIAPTWIRIPSIAVDTNVIHVGLRPDRKLQVPESYSEAGWWMKGARPGDQGAAVIVGHVDSKSGPAVFYRLRELQPGDEIQVFNAENQTVRFKVEQLQHVSKAAFPTDAVYGMTPSSTLRLITCAGRFNRQINQYPDNLIVFASLII